MTINHDAMMVNKSTVPVGYIARIKEGMQYENIMFSPYLLREGKTYHHNLDPSRIIVDYNHSVQSC